MSGAEISDGAKKSYRERLKYLRKGQECFQKKEDSKGVQFYATYLKALSGYFGISENHLDPKIFDLQKDRAELLLISQVYWDLCKAYDRSPGLQKECLRCLDQFIKFTIGFKHQHINAQLLKKYVRQNKAVNQQAFKNAMKKVLVDSKNCYVATHAYGEHHTITKELRHFKSAWLAKSSLGLTFIDVYYSLSPSLVSFCRKYKVTGNMIERIVFKPAIHLFLMLAKSRESIVKKAHS